MLVGSLQSHDEHMQCSTKNFEESFQSSIKLMKKLQVFLLKKLSFSLQQNRTQGSLPPTTDVEEGDEDE